jgi:hypothetical protein
MEQFLTHALQEIVDGLLGNAILEVRIYVTSELLLRFMTCLLEGIVAESPIVVVVMEGFHSVFGRVLLKGKLGGKCLC